MEALGISITAMLKSCMDMIACLIRKDAKVIKYSKKEILVLHL